MSKLKLYRSFLHCEGMGVRRFVRVNITPLTKLRYSDDWNAVETILDHYGYHSVTFNKLRGGNSRETWNWLTDNVSRGHRTIFPLPQQEYGKGARLFTHEADLVAFLLMFR